MKDETNIREVLNALTNKTKISESALLNLLHFEAESEVATYLNVLPADLDCVLSGQPNFAIARIFSLTEADLDNLLIEYGKEFILGMIVSKLLLK